MIQVFFYGAQSFAVGMYKAIQKIYPDCSIGGFLVSSRMNNPTEIDGLPVYELEVFAKNIDRKSSIHILISTPEDLHVEIEKTLRTYGFDQYTCMDSCKEAKLMTAFYKNQGEYPLLHDLKIGKEKAQLQIYMAKFYKDKPLINNYEHPAWISELQVGAALTEKQIAVCTDNQGDNISTKNVNYCELTALYWMWKNRLLKDIDKEYWGIYHYRRVLDIGEIDIVRMKENDVDVVLPFPTIHEPNIVGHHARYVQEGDWQAMLQALTELGPEYMAAVPKIFSQQYMYNYNMIVAKKKVLADYCAWLFPILERIEELSIPKGNERADRYIGYLGENLLTLYFMYHKNDFKIAHTGRLMLT